MSILFLDTTYDITMGILDDSLKWLDLRRFEGKKGSATLQSEADRMFSDLKILPTTLSAIITVAGPGFYTGLRLSEGFADVMSFFKIPHYSFYTYQIPLWAGMPEGTWMTKAYRGEYFFYQWQGKGQTISLIADSNLEEFLKDQTSLLIHSEKALDDKSLPLVPKFIRTIDLLKDHPQLIFAPVMAQQLRCESYYFRAPEDEFRVSS